MSNAYLSIAEIVLRGVRTPMTPTQILQRAYEARIAPDHLHGRTQHKTLHARLSEDIDQMKEKSRFFRTAPGTFFLTELLTDPTVPTAYKTRHRARPRRRDLRRGLMLTLSRAETEVMLQGSGRITIDNIGSILAAGSYKYMYWKDAQSSETALLVRSFTVVHREGHVLSYRSGRFTRAPDEAVRRSIGFGSYVTSHDADFLYESFFGIIESSLREIIIGIGLDYEHSNAARYGGAIVPRYGLMNSGKSGPPVLNVVMTYEWPTDTLLSKNNLSAIDLQWLPAMSIPNSVELYDETSSSILTSRWMSEVG